MVKFIIAAVDEAIDENDRCPPRREVMREVECMRDENEALLDELRRKSIVPARYECELKKHRAQTFIEDYHCMISTTIKGWRWTG